MAEPAPSESPSFSSSASVAPLDLPATPAAAAASEPQPFPVAADGGVAVSVEAVDSAVPAQPLSPPPPPPLPPKASMAHVEAQTIMHHLSFSEILRLGRCNKFLCNSASNAFAFKHAPFVLSSIAPMLPSDQQMGGRIVRHAPLELLWRNAPPPAADRNITTAGMIALSNPVPYEQARRFFKVLDQVSAAGSASGRAIWGLASQTAVPVLMEIWTELLQRPEIVGIKSLRIEAATTSALARASLSPPLLHVTLENLPYLTRLSVTHKKECAVLDLARSREVGSCVSAASCASDVTVASALSFSSASLSASMFKQLTSHPRMHSLQQLRLKAVDTGLHPNAELWAPAFASLPRLTALQLDQGFLLSRTLPIFTQASALRELDLIVRAYALSFVHSLLDVIALADVLRSVPPLHCRIHPVITSRCSVIEFRQSLDGADQLDQFEDRCTILPPETTF